MSSWVGHTLGAWAFTALLSQAPLHRARLFVVLGLAILPDIVDHTIDSTALRWSHTPAAILVMAIISFAGLAVIEKRANIKSFGLCLIAAFSHLFLDFWVGVNSYAMLWPLSEQRFGSPWGFLPSSPGLSLKNRFLYRNLSLELMIFGPMLYFCMGRGARRSPLTWTLAIIALIGFGISAIMIPWKGW